MVLIQSIVLFELTEFVNKLQKHHFSNISCRTYHSEQQKQQLKQRRTEGQRQGMNEEPLLI